MQGFIQKYRITEDKSKADMQARVTAEEESVNPEGLLFSLREKT